MTGGEVFAETQRPAPAFWIVTVAVIVAGATLEVLANGLDGPMIVVISLVLVLSALLRMTTSVTSERLRVVIVPLPWKTWAIAEMARCEPIVYRPLAHYGGWGWRWSPARGWAYTMRGNRGVMVHLRDGKSFLVGSQRPEDLAAALRRVSAP